MCYDSTLKEDDSDDDIEFINRYKNNCSEVYYYLTEEDFQT